MTLFSGCDDVLRFAFPPGQTFAGMGEGFFPTALGHARWPAHDELGRMQPKDMVDAGHGSYWGGDSPDHSKDIARIAHDYLQFPDAMAYVIAARTLLERTRANSASPSDRDIPTREAGRVC